VKYCNTNDKFDAFLREMGEMHDRKNAGYATAGDPLHNFRACERFGIPMYQGLAVRISDKMSRWLNIVGDANKDKVGESVEDTSIDTAVYLGLFLIALAEYKSLNYPDAEELEATGSETFFVPTSDAEARPKPEDDGYVTDPAYICVHDGKEDASDYIENITVGWTPEQYEVVNKPKAHNNDYFARSRASTLR
jgi:hypothetical protein